MIEAQHNRGYIQYWVKTEKEIPNHSAARDLRRCHFHSERENPPERAASRLPVLRSLAE